ncbi:hypothetical protein HDU98_001013, partial [Podochytrium sp. JEL0797]
AYNRLIFAELARYNTEDASITLKWTATLSKETTLFSTNWSDATVKRGIAVRFIQNEEIDFLPAYSAAGSHVVDLGGETVELMMEEVRRSPTYRTLA